MIVRHIFDAITVLVQKQLPITFKSGEQAGTEVPAGDAVQKREAAEENAAFLFVRIILSTICLRLGTVLDCNKDLFSKAVVQPQCSRTAIPPILVARYCCYLADLRRAVYPPYTPKPPQC